MLRKPLFKCICIGVEYSNKGFDRAKHLHTKWRCAIETRSKNFLDFIVLVIIFQIFFISLINMKYYTQTSEIYSSKNNHLTNQYPKTNFYIKTLLQLYFIMHFYNTRFNEFRQNAKRSHF